jgi:hypothetical protein
MSDMRTIELSRTTSAIQWAKDAREEWEKMTDHVVHLASHYGPHHRYTVEAALSLVRMASHLVAWGDVRVFRDSNLSLLCNQVTTDGQTGLVFGLIFHPQRRTCTRQGCQAVINDDGSAWTYRPDHNTCQDGRHDPSHPLDAPAPGTWSFHS